MSRIGKLPVTVPAGVTIDIKDSTVFVKGPKGGLSYTYLEGVSVHQEGDDILVSISDDQYKNLRGLTRTLIANMIE